MHLTAEELKVTYCIQIVTNVTPAMCKATQLTSIFSRNKKRETISIAEINKDNITITTKRENGLQFREIEKSM